MYYVKKTYIIKIWEKGVIMREQQFNYNYYLIRVSNLVRFNYSEHCKKIIKILPKLENSIFYYRGVLALFNQNLKVKYHQLETLILAN